MLHDHDSIYTPPPPPPLQSATIERIIGKIASAFGARRYPVPVDPTEDPTRLQQMIADNLGE